MTHSAYLLLVLLLCHTITPAISVLGIYNMTRTLANYLFQAEFLQTEDVTTEALVKRQGYNTESHSVITEDGYILVLHRLPPNNSSGNSVKYPVVVQHGNFQTSADWTLENESLAYYLSKHGYDVWLSNQRGNEYSSRHAKYDNHQSAYWNFSFTEMGLYDIPAVVDYVLNVTKARKVHYLPFSLGSTSFFAGLSKRNELSDKIALGIVLGPSTFQTHFWHGWVQLFAPLVWLMQLVSKYTGEGPAISQIFAKLLHKILPVTCHPKLDLFGICLSMLQIGMGHDLGKITKSQLHAITKISPSSSSMKTFFHEMQLMGSFRFCEYDNGPDRNLVVYGREDPPDYNLTNVRAPIALMVGKNDFIAHRDDAKTLASKLPNLVEFHYVPDDSFTHLDFCYATDVASLVYDHIVNLLHKFDNT